jgi:hypothetical protein
MTSKHDPLLGRTRPPRHLHHDHETLTPMSHTPLSITLFIRRTTTSIINLNVSTYIACNVAFSLPFIGIPIQITKLGRAANPALLVLGALHLILLTVLLFTPSIASKAHSARLIPGFLCPLSDYIKTGCTGPKDCLYARSGSCIEFVECRWSLLPLPKPQPSTLFSILSSKSELVHPKPTFEALKHICSISEPALEWNDCRKRCDYPGTKGTCSARTRPERGGLQDGWMERDESKALDGRIVSHGALVRYLAGQIFGRRDA